jgi:hypothetical protein
MSAVSKGTVADFQIIRISERLDYREPTTPAVWYEGDRTLPRESTEPPYHKGLSTSDRIITQINSGAPRNPRA